MTDPAPHARRSRLLVLGRDERMLAALEEAVGDECSLESESGPQEAVRSLSERPYAGIVVDVQVAGPWLHAVCNGYLKCQPIGRVVMVSSADDPATLMRLAVRDPRVEVLFTPVLPDSFREALFGAAEDEDVGEHTASRRTMRWLLTRS